MTLVKSANQDLSQSEQSLKSPEDAPYTSNEGICNEGFDEGNAVNDNKRSPLSNFIMTADDRKTEEPTEKDEIPAFTSRGRYMSAPAIHFNKNQGIFLATHRISLTHSINDGRFNQKTDMNTDLVDITFYDSEKPKDADGKSTEPRSCAGRLANKLGGAVLTHRNPLPSNPTMTDKIKNAFMCPPHGRVSYYIALVLMFFLLWGPLVSITREHALPGGILFSLLVLIVTGQIAGQLVVKLHLPPLLGMIITGVCYRSIPFIDIIGESIPFDLASTLRSMALVVILIRAGLGLDPEALRKLSFMVLRLTCTPCLTEATVAAIISTFTLGLPIKWGFMLGFVMAAVSPAVVVPCLLQLQDRGYGVEKGIPTLVIAAASMDDVLAISGFGVCLGMTFATGSTAWQGIKSFVEFGIGLLYALIMGIILTFIPHKNQKSVKYFRFFLLLGAGLLCLFGSQALDFGGAGALGALCTAFVTGIGWRKLEKQNFKPNVNALFTLAWLLLFQPMLFGLIGIEINIKELDLDTVKWGVLTLAISLSFRTTVAFFVVLGGNLRLRERLFVALAWLPKSTVQAAIGGIALDYARHANPNPLVQSVEEIMGQKILTIAVLAIMITAPMGAVAIMLSGPRLLDKAPSKNEKGDPES